MLGILGAMDLEVAAIRSALDGPATRTVLGSAVGSRNQYSGDLRVSAHFLLKQFEVQSARVKAALDRQLHIGQQRRAVGGRAAVLQKTLKGHARRQRGHIARNLLPRAE